MSVLILTLPLLWAQAAPAPAGTAQPVPAAAAPAVPAAAGAQPAAGATAPAGAQAAPGTAAARPAMPPAPTISKFWMAALLWTYLIGDPAHTTFHDPSASLGENMLSGLIFWAKAASLLCLVGWVLSWLVIGIKERVVGQGRWYDFILFAAVIMTPITVMLRVLESVGRMPVYRIAGTIGLTALTALVCVLLYAVWIEVALWRTVRKLGRTADVLVLVGAHLALLAGLGVGLVMQQVGLLAYLMALQGLPPEMAPTWREGLINGARMSVTFMGYVVGLRVLGTVLAELASIRARRLYSIARLSIYEANRRMWAPWVVVTVFLLVLAFTHWFLQPPRAAEMGRLYVGTLMLLCSILLTVMVTILTPLSLPTDIQQQTIYTVVSKPVRRLELVWGRMIGYMALVTALIVVFGGISLLYLWRTVHLTMDATYAAAEQAQKDKRTADYKYLTEQADQLYTRMQARVPVKGSLSFLDSRGMPHAMGIDVGMDQSMREPRSHIEGATPSTAIWSFGRVPDPFTPPGQRPNILNRRIPVDQFLLPGTLERDLDQMVLLQARIREAQMSKQQPDLPAATVSQIDAAIARNQKELERVAAEYEAKSRKSDELRDKIADAEAAGSGEGALKPLRDEFAAIHSPMVTVEMSFNVYRTTKGKIGEPVYAELQALNPRTNARFEGDVFPIKEYYTNRVLLDPSILAGCDGALKIEVRCLSPTQYLGMAESDLYLLPKSGSFGVNYMKGLFGIWLQAMVLTAIGVFAGTFLSWPVALLTTIAFFVAGQLAFSFLVDFTRQAVLGGGPFESLIRLVTHENQMSTLAPTAGVVLAKTLDSLVMPIMSMLVFVVPNFNALDVTNQVADGYAVGWNVLVLNALLGLAYALPFSLVGYFVLKNREVAA